MKVKNIFFDFDGVLAESVQVKTRAFYDLYKPFGEEIARRAVQHHEIHGGISRYEKIRLYHKEFLNIDLTDAQVQEHANRYAGLVVGGVIGAPEVHGATRFLEKHKPNMKFWIITGTPATEIKFIAEKRGISRYFEGIYGSPERKHHWTEFIIKQHGLDRNEIVFLGDAMADHDAAKFSNLHFILRETDDNRELFKPYKLSRFSDFDQLDKLIPAIL